MKKNDSIPIVGPTPTPSKMALNKGIMQNVTVKTHPVAKGLKNVSVRKTGKG